MLDDAVADAAYQHFRHKAHAPAAHHDQVGRLFLGRLADDLGRIAGFADRAEGDSRAARFFGGRGEDFFAFLADVLLQIYAYRRFIDRNGRVDVQDHEFGSDIQALHKRYGGIQRMPGMLGSVDGYENT
ncbi:hypothetical protein BGX30_001155 [Mortierella sp. GBA39]|nr:hypothetical protein BGX30_001155 [Mortierella sp. GBA39]